jgi:uncharacterized protein (DUF58 family)
MSNILGQNLLRWLDPLLNPEACLPPALQPAMAEEDADAMLKRLDLLLRQKVRFALSGERKSRLKGQGLDFSGLREYTPGDDIRKMDWSVFARTLSPHVREYQEEKQLTLWLAIDLTPSMNFGRLITKAQQAVELAGLLALMAQKAHHKLGALIIQGKHSRIISPKTGPAQVQHLMQLLLEAIEQGAVDPDTRQDHSSDGLEDHTNDPLTAACRKLGHLVQKQHTVVFLSDFLASSSAWQGPLGELSRRAQLLCLMLSDPVERSLPNELGILNLRDPETGDTVQVDTNDVELLRQYAQAIRDEQAQRLGLLREMGVATLALTETEPTQALIALLTGQEMADV